MSWKIKYIILCFIFIACKNDSIITDKSYLIEADELQSIIHNSNIKIIDFRKKEHYSKEHIVGALNIWRTDIEDKSFEYKGMMANKIQIEKLFGNLGINNKDLIVIYDDIGLCNASRLWWILQCYDFKNVKLLHGGLDAWKALNGKVTNKIPEIHKTVFTLSEKPSKTYLINKENVLKALSSNTFIIDTRTEDEYLGKKQKNGAYKSGRIPKSINIDWANAIRYDSDKSLKSISELEAIYSELNKNDTIIVYCHSGVRSAHTTFVLTQVLGFKNVKNYDGSWIEWSYYNDLPFEKDSIH